MVEWRQPSPAPGQSPDPPVREASGEPEKGETGMPIEIIDLLPIVLLFLLLPKAKAVRPLSGFNEDYLSLDTGKALRGFFALVVVFHHLAQKTETGLLFHRFTHAGYLCVAVFFFLSGYGLQRSHMNSPRYREGFLCRRLSSILVPYLAATALCWLADAARGRRYPVTDIFAAILAGEPIVPFSWYILCILGFYLAFWLMMRLCGRQYGRMLLLGCLWQLLYTTFCIRMRYGFWWYSASHLLIVGMFWAVWEDRILPILKRFYPVLFPAAAACFLVSFLCAETVPSHFLPGENSLLFTGLAAALFPLCVLCFTLKFQIGNRLLNHLGDLSLEIYLLQGAVIMLLEQNAALRQREFIWCASVLILTVVCADLFHLAMGKLLGIFRPKMPVSR